MRGVVRSGRGVVRTGRGVVRTGRGMGSCYKLTDTARAASKRIHLLNDDVVTLPQAHLQHHCN